MPSLPCVPCANQWMVLWGPDGPPEEAVFGCLKETWSPEALLNSYWWQLITIPLFNTQVEKVKWTIKSNWNQQRKSVCIFSIAFVCAKLITDAVHRVQKRKKNSNCDSFSSQHIEAQIISFNTLIFIDFISSWKIMTFMFDANSKMNRQMSPLYSNTVLCHAVKLARFATCYLAAKTVTDVPTALKTVCCAGSGEGSNCTVTMTPSCCYNSFGLQVSTSHYDFPVLKMNNEDTA